jgi:hypothetical protein
MLERQRQLTLNRGPHASLGRNDMLGSAQKFFRLSLYSLLLFAPHSAIAGSSKYLNGINIISYKVIVEKTVGGDRCNIDQESLNTSIDFVANQSTKLKIVPFSERERRSYELFKQLNVGSPSTAQEAAKKAYRDYNFMPQFYIGIMPLQTTQFTCAGSINAEVLAYFEEQAHMIPTRAPIYPPMIEIWSVKFGFVAPRQSFSNDAINLTEQIMKQLVNDWAASQ